MSRSFIVASLLAAGVLAFASSADAQQLRFSTTAPGGVASTGNTLGLSKASNQNGPGMQHSIGTFIALDPNSVDNLPANTSNPWSFGTTSDWTKNGSAAVLELPEGAQVLHAELVWAGSYDYYPEDVSAYLDSAVSMVANNAEISVQPDPATAQTLAEQSYLGFWANYYLRSADVTAFVSQHGATTYAVGGVPATQGDTTNTLSGAGWSLVVAYRDSKAPIRNLSVFVGGTFVDEDATQDYTVTGFCAPPNGVVEGKAVISSLEGDANLTGEDLSIAETAQGSFVSLSGPNNPEQNFFCSQINDRDGMLDTAGSFGNANHDPFTGANVAGGRQGWDLTTVALSSMDGHLKNDQQSAVLRTTTVGDSYFPVLVALELDVKAPDFGDSITEASKPSVVIGDEFTVTATLSNNGEALADALELAMAIDPGLSLEDFLLDGNQGDANGTAVTASALGSGVAAGGLDIGELRTAELTFKVVAPPSNGTEYLFAPDWSHRFTMCTSDPPIDESFQGPTAVVAYAGDGGEPTEPDPTEPDPSGGPSTFGDPVEEGGCGCRTAGSGSTPAGALALLALGAALATRRRRVRN